MWMSMEEEEEERGEEEGERGIGGERGGRERGKGRSVRMRLVRRGSSDETPNGMENFMLPDSALMYDME